MWQKIYTSSYTKHLLFIHQTLSFVKNTRGVERRLFVDILAKCCFLLRHRFLTLFWPWVVGYFGQIYFTVNLLSLLIWAGRSHLRRICPCSFLWLLRFTQLSQTCCPFLQIYHATTNTQTNKQISNNLPVRSYSLCSMIIKVLPSFIGTISCCT